MWCLSPAAGEPGPVRDASEWALLRLPRPFDRGTIWAAGPWLGLREPLGRHVLLVHRPTGAHRSLRLPRRGSWRPLFFRGEGGRLHTRWLLPRPEPLLLDLVWDGTPRGMRVQVRPLPQAGLQGGALAALVPAGPDRAWLAFQRPGGLRVLQMVLSPGGTDLRTCLDVPLAVNGRPRRLLSVAPPHDAVPLSTWEPWLARGAEGETYLLLLGPGGLRGYRCPPGLPLPSPVPLALRGPDRGETLVVYPLSPWLLLWHRVRGRPPRLTAVHLPSGAWWEGTPEAAGREDRPLLWDVSSRGWQVLWPLPDGRVWAMAAGPEGPVRMGFLSPDRAPDLPRVLGRLTAFRPLGDGGMPWVREREAFMAVRFPASEAAHLGSLWNRDRPEARAEGFCPSPHLLHGATPSLAAVLEEAVRGLARLPFRPPTGRMEPLSFSP